MNDVIIAKEVDGMALVRSEQSLKLIQDFYQNPEVSGKKQLISYFLRPSQKAIIDGLAEQTGKGKAEVMRDIIDEWCEIQLRDCE